MQKVGWSLRQFAAGEESPGFTGRDAG